MDDPRFPAPIEVLWPIETLSGAAEGRAAMSFAIEAFAEASLSGIESDCFARAALVTALQELVDAHGEETVALFAERLPERIRNGEYSVMRRQ